MEEEKVTRIRSSFWKIREVWCGRVESEHVRYLGGDVE